MKQQMLTPEQFQPGDVVRYFGRLLVVAPPQPRERYVAVAVEGVDGDPSVQYFERRMYRVERPDDAPAGMTFESARRAERAWLNRNLAYTAART